MIAERTSEDALTGISALRTVPHTLAAGWGGSGMMGAPAFADAFDDALLGGIAAGGRFGGLNDTQMIGANSVPDDLLADFERRQLRGVYDESLFSMDEDLSVPTPLRAPVLAELMRSIEADPDWLLPGRLDELARLIGLDDEFALYYAEAAQLGYPHDLISALLLADLLAPLVLPQLLPTARSTAQDFVDRTAAVRQRLLVIGMRAGQLAKALAADGDGLALSDEMRTLQPLVIRVAASVRLLRHVHRAASRYAASI